MLYCKGVSQYCLDYTFQQGTLVSSWCLTELLLSYNALTLASTLPTALCTSQESFEVAIFSPCKTGFHMVFFSNLLSVCYLSLSRAGICPVFSSLSLLKLFFHYSSLPTSYPLFFYQPPPLRSLFTPSMGHFQFIDFNKYSTLSPKSTDSTLGSTYLHIYMYVRTWMSVFMFLLSHSLKCIPGASIYLQSR